MVKFSSHAVAAVCVTGLAIAALNPVLHWPAAAPRDVEATALEATALEAAVVDDNLSEPGTVIGELPVSVVMSTFDLQATDASEFGDLDQR